MVVGAGGELGRALAAAVPPEVELIALDRKALDITSSEAVTALLKRERPRLVFNAAAYTSADQAETDRDRAFLVNATAPGRLAEIAQRLGVRLIHVSTDYVFSGTGGRPYRPDDAAAPVNVYGASKLAGEQAVLAAHPRALVVRTAWIYSPSGFNFVSTMLRLMRERPSVSVVTDQIGTPTHAVSLARALWSLGGSDATGRLHWTDAGVASWYDFAVAIAEEALAAGLLEHPADVRPIMTQDYPTPARRPPFSVLDKSEAWRVTGPARHWRAELRSCMERMGRG